MKIKILATGSSKWERFIRRWGVSFLIDEDVLFDTFGDLKVLLNNIRKFNIDISKIKHIVLSHDHWDHVGGLWYLINNRKDITVYICSGFKQETKDKIASFGVNVVEVSPLTMIKKDLFSSGQIQAFYAGNSLFEQALVIKFLKNLTVITGCAHPGIVNIIDTVKKYFLREKVSFVMGGLHLKDSSNLQIEEVISALKARGISKVASMHCTGKAATKLLKKRFGINFLRVVEGSVIEA